MLEIGLNEEPRPRRDFFLTNVITISFMLTYKFVKSFGVVAKEVNICFDKYLFFVKVKQMAHYSDYSDLELLAALKKTALKPLTRSITGIGNRFCNTPSTCFPLSKTPKRWCKIYL